MAAALLAFTAYLLYLIVEPIMPLSGGRTYGFDKLALAEAASILSGGAMVSWTVTFLFVRRSPVPLAAALSIAFTWILLGVPFVLIDRFGFLTAEVEGLRASEVIANGNDLAFVPLIIPVISLVSGGFYVAALSLSPLFRRVLRRDSTAPG
jgi:hypothetical protein